LIKKAKLSFETLMRGLNLNVWLSRRRSLEKDLRRGGGSAIPPPFGE
jgi:hypothetical protein